jgi:hypothetical protein
VLAEQQGLSDMVLAHQADVDVRVVRRMFANQWEQLYLTQLAKVADGLGVPIRALIEETDE